MEDAQPDPAVFISHSLPRDPRLWATVTNAYLGTRVYHNTLHVSGVYSGAGAGAHRAVLPSPLNVRLEAPAGAGARLTETFALDTNTGGCIRPILSPSGGNHTTILACTYFAQGSRIEKEAKRGNGLWPLWASFPLLWAPGSVKLVQGCWAGVSPSRSGEVFLGARDLLPDQGGTTPCLLSPSWGSPFPLPLPRLTRFPTLPGSFLHTLEGPSFRASQCIYAHRMLPHILAFSVCIAREAVESSPVRVLLQSAFSPESPDLDLHLGPDFQGFRYLWGLTLTPEQPGDPRQEVHMLWTPVPPALTLGEGEDTKTWDFLTVVGGSQVEAQACLTEALQLQARGSLYAIHVQAWAQFWAGCHLNVAGPLALCQALRSSFYYLFSALPQPGTSGYVSHGLSPGGLSNGSQGECYWGHVFWDQDLWMFPNILMFHPEAARALLEYRVRTLGGALKNAQALNYQGAKFAWESAGSGLEVCPEDIYGAQEIHINGAVVLAFQLYYHATQDLQFFQEAGGWDVISAVAEFWCSRVEWNPREKKFYLRGVMPPDEYHAGVDNSVYTNVLVQNSLRFAADLARDLGQPIPDQWLVVADKIKVPFDPERNFHPEFDGYEPGEEVKQADVVLLGYPVPFSLSPDVRRRNLEIYEAATSPRGPAMTWSMFAVGWMELKDPSRARSLLDRNITNVTEPFKVWTENADGSGAVNFLTGMGGFLQAVLFGCTGFRVTCTGVIFDPLCLTDISTVCVSGIFYQGNRLNFTFCKDSVMVEVTAQAWPGAPQLEVELWPSRAQLPLLLGHQVSFPCSAGRIQRSLP